MKWSFHFWPSFISCIANFRESCKKWFSLGTLSGRYSSKYFHFSSEICEQHSLTPTSVSYTHFYLGMFICRVKIFFSRKVFLDIKKSLLMTTFIRNISCLSNSLCLVFGVWHLSHPQKTVDRQFSSSKSLNSSKCIYIYIYSPNNSSKFASADVSVMIPFSALCSRLKNF